MTLGLLLSALTLPATSSLGTWSPAPSGHEVGTDDFRLTHTGTDGDTTRQAAQPAIAYNPVDNEFLVVWADNEISSITYQVMGRRIDADTGELIGADSFQITDMGKGASGPAVAYNTHLHEYMVVFHGRESGLDTVQIHAQRLNASTGAEVGADDFPISDMARGATYPAITFGTTYGRYFVVWMGDDSASTGQFKNEIYGQMLGGTGVEQGTNDLSIGTMGTAIDDWCLGQNPKVAYNSTDNNYLVVWEGDEENLSHYEPCFFDEFEIYGRQVSGTGALIGSDYSRYSDMMGDAAGAAFNPDVTYNGRNNEYLVVWHGADDIPPADGHFEIFAQRVAGATGAETGTNDFYISDMGVPGENFRLAHYAHVDYDPSENRYLVVWLGDDDDSGCAQCEYELHGQFLDGVTGADIFQNDFRFTTMGPDGSCDWLVTSDSAVAYGGGETGWLSVWKGDNNLPGLVDNEYEIYGQFLTDSRLDLFIANDSRIPKPRMLIPLASR